MPYVDSFGNQISGVGQGQLWRWKLNDAAPLAIGTGAAGGWRNGQFVGTAPRVREWSPAIGTDPGDWPVWLTEQEYGANIIVAGGPYWGASNGQTSIGDVPPGYESWQWWAIGNDGTRVMVLNGQYRVWWPNGNAHELIGAGAVSVGDGCIVNVFSDGELYQLLQDGTPVKPAQRPGLKYFATTVRSADGASWLIYSSAELGQFICHRADDATQGYILDDLTMLGPVGPCGVTLADGRTVIGWARGPAQQGGDLRRAVLQLGVNMVPFVVASPEPPEPEPEPPQPEPPNPEPEPEPTPMPKTPKDQERYETRITAAVVARTGMPLEQARQGVRQAADRYELCQPPIDWSGNALAEGAFCRDGADAILIEATKLDLLFNDCKVIDAEELQR